MSSAAVPAENEDQESGQPNMSQPLIEPDIDHVTEDTAQLPEQSVGNALVTEAAFGVPPQPPPPFEAIANNTVAPPPRNSEAMDSSTNVAPTTTTTTATRGHGTESGSNVARPGGVATETTQTHDRPRRPPGNNHQRSRFSYAKRFLVAPDEFWIHDNFYQDFLRRFRPNETDNPVRVVGKIMECPSKKNGNAYSIIWDNGTISTMQVPQNWIKSQFISTKTVKERLRQYIEAYRPNGEPSATQQQQQQSQVSEAHGGSNNVTQSPALRRSPRRGNTQSPALRRSPRRGNTARAPPPPPPTTERARRRDALRNASNSSLRHSNRRTRSNPPSTQERAQGRATLMTAPRGEPSPAMNNFEAATGDEDNNHTPINQVATRLFGTSNTRDSTGTTDTAAQQLQPNNNSIEMAVIPTVTTRRQQQQQNNARANDDIDDNGSSSDEDADGGFELDFNDTVQRSQNPLDDYCQSDDNDSAQDNTQKDDGESTDSVSDDEDPNNSTNLKVLIDNLHFHYKEVDASTNMLSWIGKERHNRSMFRGEDGLKAGVADEFHTPLDCIRVIGGLSNSLISDMAAATNQYFHQKIRPRLMGRRGYYHSQKWKDVTAQEMTRFLGIVLMMSLRPVDGGGYASYFQTSNRMYSLGTALPSVEILDSEGWASRYMRLARFRQIRGAFHFENKGAARGGDKCYQLRKLIQAVNAASKRSFRIPQDLAFDEGGIGCRSRYCPVRQYNKDKPQKFRVDFFILASSRSYAILHLDVYQGKNATNSYIREEAKKLPTTMKAVVNACYALELHKETNGFRHLAMDNRYAAPQLLVILRDRLKILATGTVRSNRVG